MTPQQFTNHWRKIVFSGTGKEPRTFDSESELVAFVARTPGAIGYVDSSTPHARVKTLEVNQKGLEECDDG
jgi:ABC-type phosphate transport system substrate-binding protein